MLRKKTKLISLGTLLFISLGFFSGCNQGGTEGGNTTVADANTTAQPPVTDTTQAPPEQTGGQKLTWNIASDPRYIDPTLNSATNGSTVIRALFEGLTKMDPSGVVIPGVAESLPEVSSDGLVYKFKISSAAKWSDGKPVTANDFVYSYKRGLTPETAAEYAIELFNLKNGQAFNEGKVPFEEVGVKALDEATLELTLENPVSYFPELLTNSIYMPLREDIVSKPAAALDSWTRDPVTCIGNGPFILKEWTEKDKIVVVKNENWRGAADVKLDEITFKMIEEATTALADFRKGDLDYTEQPPTVEIAQLINEGLCKIFPYIGTYYLDINQSPELEKVSPEAAKALSDVKVRKALSLAIDRQSIIDAITMAEEKPALGFVPFGIKDDKGQDFTNKSYFNDNDVETAKQLLADAGYPNGEGFPTLQYRYNTDERHKNIAEALQSMWKDNLNINVELSNEEWKTFQVTRTDKQYVMARDGWIGDYMDPNTFLELLHSKNGNNNSGYNNPAYDEKIEAAKKEVDKAKRVQLLRDAEAILMEDAPIIPIFYYTLPVAMQPYVKGVAKLPTGAVYFENVYIEGK